MGIEPEIIPRDGTSGNLQIGSSYNDLVVVNLPRSGIMHLAFTPEQARDFASKILQVAKQIENKDLMRLE